MSKTTYKIEFSTIDNSHEKEIKLLMEDYYEDEHYEDEHEDEIKKINYEKEIKLLMEDYYEDEHYEDEHEDEIKKINYENKIKLIQKVVTDKLALFSRKKVKYVILRDSENKIVGFSVFDLYHLCILIINKEHRRKGMEKLLIQKFFDETSYISLSVYVNKWTEQFFKSIGGRFSNTGDFGENQMIFINPKVHFYRLMNRKENHRSYQYKKGLNILENFNSNDNISGLFFTIPCEVTRWVFGGGEIDGEIVQIYEVILPEYAIVCESDGRNFRTDQFILGESMEIQKWLDKNQEYIEKIKELNKELNESNIELEFTENLIYKLGNELNEYPIYDKIKFEVLSEKLEYEFDIIKLKSLIKILSDKIDYHENFFNLNPKFF